VLFDPGSVIPKNVTFPRTCEALSAQALSAPLMIDRYDALVALRESPLAEKRDLLLTSYAREMFHAPKAEAVSQLKGDDDPRSVALIKKALRDAAVEVRSSTLNTFWEGVPELFRADVELLLTDSSYQIVHDALLALWDSFPSERPRYLRLTAQDRGVGNQVRVRWHELNARSGEKSSLDTLVDYAGPSFEFRTRVNAFEALKRSNHLCTALAAHLCDAMVHPNARLRGPATAVAEYFLQQTSHKEMLLAYHTSRTWLPWQEEILDRTFRKR
jgi:aminopeptidase N